MADLSYDVQVNTAAAERNLAQLQQSVTGINTAFAGLRTALASISLGAVIAQSIRFADAIQDLSDATEISTATILGFTRAVQANGGSAEAAQKGLARLVGSIDEAANKSGEAREAFADAGVSLNDLRTLSAEDIFKRTVEGLGNVDDVTKRAALSTRLLGKEFRGVNAQGVGQGFAGSVAASREYAASIKSAADAQQSLETALNNLQLALLKAIKPLTDFVAQIDLDKVEIFVDRLIKIGAALAGLFIATKAAGAVRGLVDAQRMLAGQTVRSTGVLAEAALGVRQLGEAFNIGTARTVSSYTGFGVLGITLKSLAGGFVRLIPLVGAAYAAFQILDGAVEMLTGRDIGSWFDGLAASAEKFVTTSFPRLAAALNSLGKTLGMAPPPSEVAAAEKAAADRLANLKEEQAEVDAVRKKQAELIRGQEALAKLANDIAKQAAAYKLVNAEHTRYTEQLRASMGFQVGIIGLTEDQVELETNLRQEAERYQAVVVKLADKQQELRNSMIGEKDVEKVQLYRAEIAEIEKTVKLVSDQHLKNRDIIDRQTTAVQSARLVEQARKQDIENTTAAINAQLERQSALGDILRGINDQRVNVGIEADQQGKGPLARQFEQIQQSARSAALEAGRAFSSAFNTEDGLTPEQAQELADGLDAIAEGYRGIAAAQTEVLTNSQTFASGLAETFAAYAESANNAASQAKTYFDTFTGGMEDALVKFVQTGKLSFKDLANSLIADLIRIQTRKIITGLFGGAGGGGILGGLFGMSAGGPTDMSPMIVGERGPELFVPGSAGRIVPNNQLGGGAVMQNLTTVNYNIQAVDASSFRALVARDPQFIFSVTEKGRRSQPTRSR